MKKHGCLNAEISDVISRMGHTDLIMVGDCGLPIPDGIRRIDLALKPGSPNFIETLEVVCRNLTIEKYILATEIEDNNQYVWEQTLELLSDIPAEYVSHEELKACSKDVKAIIRTGEITPYANIILKAGVNFKELNENYSKEY